VSKTSDKAASRQSGNAGGEQSPPRDEQSARRPQPVIPGPKYSLDAALPELRRPFAPPAVKFKVQSVLSSNRGLMVTYVDARLVQERLDLVCGGDWSSTLEEFAGGIKCSLTLFGVTREDVGKGNFEKASASDALKRAAVHFGVGASLYATPTWILKSTAKGTVDENNKPSLRAVERKGKMNLWITDPCERWLREQYAIWLLSPQGEERFGYAFDHGAAADTVGDAAGEGVQMALDDDDDQAMDEHRDRAQAAYEAALEAGMKRSDFPKGRFDARLRACETKADVDALVADITAKIP
jgi:hypothetical protein